MEVMGFLVVLIVLLLFLFGRLYPKHAEDSKPVESYRDDRLATLVEPDLMEALQTLARQEGRSCVEVANELLRGAVRGRGL